MYTSSFQILIDMQKAKKKNNIFLMLKHFIVNKTHVITHPDNISVISKRIRQCNGGVRAEWSESLTQDLQDHLPLTAVGSNTVRDFRFFQNHMRSSSTSKSWKVDIWSKKCRCDLKPYTTREFSKQRGKTYIRGSKGLLQKTDVSFHTFASPLLSSQFCKL